MRAADWVGVGLLGVVVVGGVVYVVTRPPPTREQVAQKPADAPDVRAMERAAQEEAKRRAVAVANKVRDTGQGAANVLGDLVGGFGKVVSDINSTLSSVGNMFGDLKLFA